MAVGLSAVWRSQRGNASPSRRLRPRTAHNRPGTRHPWCPRRRKESHGTLEPPAAGRVDRGSRRDGGGLCRPGDRCVPAGPWHRPAGAATRPPTGRGGCSSRGRLRSHRRTLPRPDPAGAGRQGPCAGTRQRHGAGRPRHPAGGRLGLVAQTVETVRFTRPERVDFRLVRGPVPHVVEAFTLEEQPDGAGTLLVYQGQLAADLWRLAGGGASWSPAAGSRRSRPRWQRSRLKPNGGQQQPRPLGVRAAASRRPRTIEIGRAAPQTAYSDASREAPAPVIGQAERVPSALVRRTWARITPAAISPRPAPGAVA
jgi:hypothetical protein